MSENLQLVTSETELVGQKIKWIESDGVDLSDLMNLLIQSQKNEGNQSIKNVLDICIVKLDEILSNQIPEVNKSIKRILGTLDILNAEASKAQVKNSRAPRKSNSSNRTRKSKVVDINSVTEPSIKDNKTLVAK